MTATKISRLSAPPASALLGDLRGFYHWDSYEAPLQRDELAMHEIYLGLFAHHPHWVRRLLILRGWIVAPFGLKTTTAADLDNIEIKPAYAVGEKVAWADDHTARANQSRLAALTAPPPWQSPSRQSA